VALNIIYEYAKGKGILGNIVFGLMITMAPLFGGYASGPTGSTVLLPHRVSVLILVWVMNSLMTYYTYFKDYKGDKAAGKRTLVVSFGLQASRWIAILSAFLPTVIFILLRVSGLHQTPLNTTFMILGALTVFLQIWTGMLYYRHPTGQGAHASLVTNFRACTCGQAALIAIFNPDLALWLFIFSYIFVGFLFDFHKDHQQ
jgi:geranylgeranylglycerol-phosphate geranylgeranyltransferase